MNDLISRQAAIDAITCLIDRFEQILRNIRESKGDDSVCGMCEYNGAYIGQSGDWVNECPGFDKDDCFKLSDKCRKRWLKSVVLPSSQPEQRPLTEDDYAYCAECDPEAKCLSCGHHIAERPFEVYCNIMCKWVNEKDYCTMFEPGQEKMRKNGDANMKDDLISRRAAIDALNSINCFGWVEDSWAKVSGIIEHVPSAQPEIIRCKDCRWWDKFGNYDNGYCLAVKHSYLSEHLEIRIRRICKGDFYCADAEPKGEQE